MTFYGAIADQNPELFLYAGAASDTSGTNKKSKSQSDGSSDNVLPS